MSKESHTVLAFIQDKSVLNLLKFILSENNITLCEYSPKLTPKQLKSTKLIIVDNELRKTHTFPNSLKSIIQKTPILLTISDNYDSFLSKALPFYVIGIIYKPFDVEELLTIIKQILSKHHDSTTQQKHLSLN